MLRRHFGSASGWSGCHGLLKPGGEFPKLSGDSVQCDGSRWLQCFELLPPSEVPPPDVDIMSSRAERFCLLEFDVLVEVIVDWEHGGGGLGDIGMAGRV